jgi:hypothetical protein
MNETPPTFSTVKQVAEAYIRTGPHAETKAERLKRLLSNLGGKVCTAADWQAHTFTVLPTTTRRPACDGSTRSSKRRVGKMEKMGGSFASLPSLQFPASPTKHLRLPFARCPNTNANVESKPPQRP